MIRKIMVVMAVLFLLSPAITFAADFCAADNNGDCKVDLTDLVTMKSEFMKPDCEACSPAYPAPVEKTGQDACYDDSGQEYECTVYGLEWPNPRFTDHGDGTVTDNLSGLMWTKADNILVGVRMVLWEAIDYIGAMNRGDHENYGYTDWRLPNIRELLSLIDYGEYAPALPPGHPFSLQFSQYWTSTSHIYSRRNAWCVSTVDGQSSQVDKSYTAYVWPVRGPE